jgi:sulfite dehydrogenase (quinone) subunit SoeB
MKLGLLIDMDTCVGCHACAVACKEWNAQSPMAGGAPDYDAQGESPSGVWFNRVRHYEIEGADNGAHGQCSRTLNVPMSCMHCEDAACVTVCPTGASYKREKDGIVLVDPEKCMGCNYCAWACPYGARELDTNAGVMRKCTLCVDRIYDESLPERERQPACVLACPTHARHFGDFEDPDSNVSTLSRQRGGVPMMPALGYQPVNAYLPPRPPAQVAVSAQSPARGSLRERLGAMINRIVPL